MYLDNRSKAYYSRDFIDNVLLETDSFWKLNEPIKPYLIFLNSIEAIQPLYSKFPDTQSSFGASESYLTIAYTKDIELTLFRQLLPFLIIKYNDPEEHTKFYYAFSEPVNNANYSQEKTKFSLGCISNPDYFRINHLTLTFESYDGQKHIEFWEDLKSKLGKMHLDQQ